MAEYIKPEKDRYIKLSQALEVLDRCSCWWAHDWMELIPAADVWPVVHGEWKLNNDGSGTCSVCHFTQSSVWDDDGWQNFCGHCGADMKELNQNWLDWLKQEAKDGYN